MAGDGRTGFLIILIAWCLVAPTPAGADIIRTKVRPSVLAGSWYPADPKELAASINKFTAKARPPRLPGRLIALVAPHAGYMYSGQTAAYAFSLLKGQNIETVVLVGPSHRARFDGVLLDTRDYETPLGRVPLDRDLAERLLKFGPPILSRPEAHAREHCLEIELPFLQKVLGRVKIVPLLMGAQDLKTCRTLADNLAQAIGGRKALLLASTDLSHFHSAAKAQALDGRLIEHVRAFDPESLHQDLAGGRIEACGGGALTAVMMAARNLGADRAVILNYAHSGQVTGDNARVVGYLAAALVKAASAQKPSEAAAPAGVSLGLSQKDQHQLLTIARRSITSALEGKNFSPPENLSARLLAPRGAFVTLKHCGCLRGCIGRLTADRPLAEVVAAMAVQAAFHDPRFPPLTKEEIEGLHLEISALTPFEKVRDVREIKVGVHGLVVVKGARRGLLLPQVPLEQGWDRKRFLEQTCRKAGLPPQAWKQGADLYRFSAQVFGEKDVRPKR